MSRLVQMHHILPNRVHSKFASSIAAWTGNSFNQNAAYNLIPTSVTQAGAESSLVAQHNGSHPWLNEAYSASLSALRDDPSLNNAQKGLHFSAIHSYFRSGLDIYGGDPQTDFLTFLTRTDPAAMSHFGGKPATGQMRAYFLDNHSGKYVLGSAAYNDSLSGVIRNGSFGAGDADDSIMPLRSYTNKGTPIHVLDAQKAREHFGVKIVDFDIGTFETKLSTSQIYLGAGSLCSTIAVNGRVSQAEKARRMQSDTSTAATTGSTVGIEAKAPFASANSARLFEDRNRDRSRGVVR